MPGGAALIEVLASIARMGILAWCATLLVVVSLCYSLTLLVLSRTRRASAVASAQLAGPADPDPNRAPDPLRAQPDPDHEPLVVFLVPCLNEGRVIGASLDYLLAQPYRNSRILVIDDASTDDTAAIVADRATRDPRIHLLTRRLPEAQLGKGAALNCALASLSELGVIGAERPEDVIIAVVDADGRMEAETLAEVVPSFRDERIGAVQIGVRINNRHVNRLARMQDMEFVIYTDVFQKGRRRIGSVGLGGNGQFMRLAALNSLGTAPWSDSLTEDLDLGVRLLSQGWRNEYCPVVAVHQQGVVDLSRLIRQRTRWFQGGLQAWRLLPSVVRNVPGVQRLDLLWLLTAPFLVLLASVLSLAFVAGLAAYCVGGVAPSVPQMIAAYLLGFGPILLLARVYFERERDEGVYGVEVAGLSHLYVFYGMIWYVCGWLAVVRVLRGQTGWVKTARSSETAAAAGKVVPTRTLDKVGLP